MDVVYDIGFEKQRNFCDAGPHIGMYRYMPYVYLTRAEQDGLDARNEDFPALALVSAVKPVPEMSDQELREAVAAAEARIKAIEAEQEYRITIGVPSPGPEDV